MKGKMALFILFVLVTIPILSVPAVSSVTDRAVYLTDEQNRLLRAPDGIEGAGTGGVGSGLNGSLQDVYFADNKTLLIWGGKYIDAEGWVLVFNLTPGCYRVTMVWDGWWWYDGTNTSPVFAEFGVYTGHVEYYERPYYKSDELLSREITTNGSIGIALNFTLQEGQFLGVFIILSEYDQPYTYVRIDQCMLLWNTTQNLSPLPPPPPPPSPTTPEEQQTVNATATAITVWSILGAIGLVLFRRWGS